MDVGKRACGEGLRAGRDETRMFPAVPTEEVVLMHGRTWRVRERALVRIEGITDPSGTPLGASNWRLGYVGAYGRATFADDAEGSGLSVVQIRGVSYPQGADGAGVPKASAAPNLRATRDILRSSSGRLSEDGDLVVLITRRTRYTFRRVTGDEAAAVASASALA